MSSSAIGLARPFPVHHNRRSRRNFEVLLLEALGCLKPMVPFVSGDNNLAVLELYLDLEELSVILLLDLEHFGFRASHDDPPFLEPLRDLPGSRP
jgi:hypothetical protein